MLVVVVGLMILMKLMGSTATSLTVPAQTHRRCGTKEIMIRSTRGRESDLSAKTMSNLQKLRRSPAKLVLDEARENSLLRCAGLRTE